MAAACARSSGLRSRCRASQTARASLRPSGSASSTTPAAPAQATSSTRLQPAGFAAAAIEAAKQKRDDARQNYLLRRVAVAGFAAMNIMLLSIAVWSGEASDMDAGAGGRFPLAVGADRAANGRLCRASRSSAPRSAR